jgi:radical SAM protein with 4Fe4S-binding SPASM domain
MRRDFCDLAEYVNGLGIVWSVNTNATMLDDKIARRLLRAQAHVVTVSLDGPTAEINDSVRGPGVFEKVCENTAILTALRDKLNPDTRVVISCTLVRRNAEDVGRMVDLAKSLGVNSLILSELQIRGNARQSADSLRVHKTSEIDIGVRVAENLSKNRTQHVQLGFLTPVAIQYINEAYGTQFPIYDASCGALTQKGYIQPDGALFPCQSMTDKETMPSIIGPMFRMSLAQFDFEDIWHSRRYGSIKELLFSNSVDHYKLPCKYCKYFRTLCYPCPLGALGSQWSLHQLCLEAMSRLADLRGMDAPWHELLNKKPIIENQAELNVKEDCR